MAPPACSMSRSAACCSMKISGTPSPTVSSTGISTALSAALSAMLSLPLPTRPMSVPRRRRPVIYSGGRPAETFRPFTGDTCTPSCRSILLNRMSMRPLTLILVFGGMVALLMFGVLRRHRLKHPEPYFFNRAIVAPGLYRRLWPKELPDEVEKEHQAVSDRVLLIRTPAIVDHADFSNQQGSVAHQPWNFADVIQRAFKIGGAPHPAAQSLADSLRAALSNATYFPGAVNHNFARAWADADPLFSLAKAPVRLLAIINRIDLARTQDIYANCPADKPFGGAELRFIYSARTSTDDEHYLSLIVEFILPCKTAAELQSIGNEWWPLKDMDPSSPKYRATLEGILDRRTIESGQVRLRVNGKATNSWNTREFGFTASGINPQDLARQYSAEVRLGVCQDSSQLLGKYVHANLPGVNDSNYTYGSGDPLATKTATIADPDESFHAVLTLGENLTDSSNQTLSGKAADDARY